MFELLLISHAPHSLRTDLGPHEEQRIAFLLERDRLRPGLRQRFGRVLVRLGAWIDPGAPTAVAARNGRVGQPIA